MRSQRIDLANLPNRPHKGRGRKQGAQKGNQNARVGSWTATMERSLQDMFNREERRISRRNVNDKKYMYRALRAMEARPELRNYFFDKRTGRIKKTTLSHLGRIENPRNLLTAAKEIMAKMMNEVQARRFCKKVRSLGGEILFRHGIPGS